MGLTSLGNVLDALDREQLLRRYESGRGQGEKLDYRPWLTAREVKSHGQSYVIGGTIIDRLYECLSGNELLVFLALQRRGRATDIREQYPLWPLESTEKIADRLGVVHPRVPNSPHLSLMTTDFVVTTDEPGELVPVHVKPAEQLGQRRNQEKLDIELEWWAERGCKLRVVTNLEIPKVLGENLRSMAACWTVTPETLGTMALEDVEAAFLRKLAKDPGRPANVLAHDVDKALGLDPGVCLTVFWHMVSRRRLRIDLTAPFVSTEPFRLVPGPGG